MATTIVRTPMVDDDGTGTTGTVINNSWKTELYDQIDAALAAIGSGGGWVGSVVGQIPFPAAQNASTNANTLDDYEEGAWTPTVVGDGGGAATYSQQSGAYTKIGRLVFVSGTVRIASKGTLAGNIQIGGFPFLPTGPGGGPVTYFETAAAVASIIMDASSGVTNYLKVLKAAGTAYGFLAVADLNPNSVFVFNATYATN